ARWRRSHTTHKTRKGRGGDPRGLSRVTFRRVNDGGTNSIEPLFRVGCKQQTHKFGGRPRSAVIAGEHETRLSPSMARGLVGLIHRKTFATPHSVTQPHAQAMPAPVQPRSVQAK